VVSAAAAAAWFYQPGLEAHEVMRTVYDSGEDLLRTASFALGDTTLRATTHNIHRVSVCRAAQKSLQDSGSSVVLSCPTGLDIKAYNGQHPPPPDYVAGIVSTRALAPPSIFGGVEPQPGWPCPDCYAVMPKFYDDDWSIEGAIAYDAWSQLGAEDIQVNDASAPHVALFDSQMQAISVNESGFSTTSGPHAGDDAFWTIPSPPASLALYGTFTVAPSTSEPEVKHVVVLFQQRASDTLPWSSAAQEIDIK
jgi:hypothetical protein